MPDKRIALEKSNGEAVEVDAELARKLDSLEDVRNGAPPFEWTPEMDALLLRYWPVKNKDQVAKVLGCSTSTARSRWRELNNR